MKTFAVLLCIILTSCATKKIKNSDFVEIDQNLKVEILNEPTDGGTIDFLRLFALDQNVSNVIIEFDTNKSIRLSFDHTDFKERQFKVFEGKFKRKFFEVFLEKKRIVFPPIYWISQIKRLRISISKDSTLVVEHYWDHSGMILFMGAGSSSKTYHQYALIEK